MITRFKKFISIVLVVLLLASNVTVLPIFAANRAGLSGKTILGDSVLNYEQELVDNGDGTFSYKITLDSAYAVVDKNIDSTKSQDGYFTAAKSGQYLIELWGGDGGSGAKTSYNEGGKGGKGGHIYGTVHLDVGETLYWQLGGHGSQTSVSGTGGGANGTGGGHGSWGNYTIGGGGGFSAVYKFDAYTFESIYTDDSGELIGDIKDPDRNSKYIMIAGGGGGGGAGNGYALGATITGTPDGGAGGSIGSTAGELNGAGYDVEGTFFKGSDGRSSGTSTAYVGKGGTNLPGKVTNTFLAWAEGTQPNDWKGTYNTSTFGGSGGTGEVRGGGGGAGFCGGSGGCQASVLLPSDIGGGGGGSSFISNEVTYTSLSDKAAYYLKNTNPSSTGGAVKVTFLGENNPEDLQDLKISAVSSKYFQVNVAYITVGGERMSVADWDHENGNQHVHDGIHVNVDNINLTNAVDGTASTSDSSITLEIVLAPKAGFAGGNNVPLLGDSENQVAAPGIRITNGNENSTVIRVNEACSYANVSYNIQINPKSHITNVAGRTYNHTDLYEDNLTAARNYLAGSNPGYEDAWAYDFISSMSAFYLTDSTFKKISGNTVAPMVTTNYHVTVDVVPTNNGVAKVGTPLTATSLFKHAIITVLSDQDEVLNDNIIKYAKNLEYNTELNRYELSLYIEADKEKAVISTPDAIKASYLSNANEDIDYVQIEDTVEVSGYYRIEAWGGNGAQGGGSSWVDRNGGNGGTGGYVTGYIYLEKGEMIFVNMGRNGISDGSPYNGGPGGEITVVSKGSSGSSIETSTPVIIAGSGGGGGGSWLFGQGTDGGSVTETVNADTYGEYSTYVGKDGQGAFAGANGGAAGKNFINSSYINVADNDNPLKVDWEAGATGTGQGGYNASSSGGAVHITCIQMDPVSESGATVPILENYSFAAVFSRYFDVIKEQIYIESSSSGSEPAELVTPASITVTEGYVNITGINPPIHGEDDFSLLNHVRFEIVIPFNPREGFLGGNDVPVLTETQDCPTGMRFGQGVVEGYSTPASFSVPEKNETDFANVKILSAYNGSNYQGTLVGYERFRNQGAPGIHRQHMYSWNRDNIPSTGEDSWRAEFVTQSAIIMLKDNGTIVNDDPIVPNPDITTEYTIEAGIYPLREAVYAKVIPSVSAATSSATTTINVTTFITYKLEHISTSAITDSNGNVDVTPGFPHEATLTPHAEYLLPDTIVVTSDIDGETIPHIYNKANGSIHISSEHLTEPITISASGIKEKHKIYYAYQNYENGKVENYDDIEEQFVLVTCGAVLQPIVETMPGRQGNPYEGHYYVWEWGTATGTPPAVMPHGDLLVRGVYRPIDCNLTINYYTTESGVSSLYSTTTVALKYGDTYHVASPVINNFVTDTPVVNGTITTDTAIDVFYVNSQGRLTINYIKSDTSELITASSVTYKAGETFSIVSPEVPGYSPDIKVVSGEMIAEGLTYRVYYNPEHYVITFDTNEGNPLGTPTREAIYNSLYMIDGESGKYVPFPTPVYVGHAFDGWYFDKEGTKPVTEGAIVSIPSDHTLYAKWDTRTYTVTVDYVNEHGINLTDSAIETVVLGEHYSITSPIFDDYILADESQTVVSGTALAQNTHIIVNYVKKFHTLTINYLYDDSVADSTLHGTTAAATYVTTLAISTPYEVVSPTIDHFTPSQATVSGIMERSDITVDVYYFDADVEIKISVTVTWGDMTFDYTYGKWQPDAHKYATDTIEPSSTNSNKISIANNSDIAVTAELSYASESGYEGIGAKFTNGDRPTDTQIDSFHIQKDTSKSAWLWLTGTLPDSSQETIPVGVCTVTIRGGLAY